MQNPLLEKFELPPFNEIKAEHIVPAISTLIENNLVQISSLAENLTDFTWSALIEPIDELEDKLSQAWSPVGHINSVANTPEWREAYNACLPKLSEYSTQIGQNHKLYNAYQTLEQSPAFSDLNAAQKKVITNAIRDFKLSGVALGEKERQEYAKIDQALSQLQSKFQDNVMDATDNWHRDVTDVSVLNGLSAQAIDAAKRAAENAKVTGWRLTLDYPCFQAVMTYADNRNLRQTLHEAYSTRASNKGPDAGKWDNSSIMEEILKLRYQKAQLLGYKNYGERSLATKMVKSSEQVMAFLNDLAEKVKPIAMKEYQELKEFARSEYGIEDFQPWDISYYSEKLKQHAYAVSQEELRAYFPLNQVLDGMFEVVKRLYGLTFKQNKKVHTWHPDVTFFEVYDEKQRRGMFYLDCFARSQKRGGAWMDEAKVRRRKPNGEVQLPVAYLTCNFRAPTKTTPSLLTHDEVITLFHEFGHGLHHMLTMIDEPSVSGIHGVAWDAVELPSQFLENWCWQEQALELISSHYQTNEPLPKAMLDKMLKAKNFQSALMLVRQLEFALFDFRMHTEFSDQKTDFIQTVLDEVRKQVSVIPAAPYNCFQHSFSHIFAGGYAAGYYSYLWAEVLACDAFSRFEQEGIFNRETGLSFMKNILEQGGSQDAEALFKAFTGREPQIAPFLKSHGILD